MRISEVRSGEVARVRWKEAVVNIAALGKKKVPAVVEAVIGGVKKCY
jgi:hypothetical protein